MQVQGNKQNCRTPTENTPKSRGAANFSRAPTKNTLNLSNAKGAREAVSTLLREQELFLPSPPPLWEMVHLMWSAPITKFWTFQIFYIAYLALFSVAVLLPSCGNWYVDLAVCAWTALIALESVRRTLVLYKGSIRAPLALRCVEVVLMLGFVCLYALGRLAGPWPWLSPYTVKVLLCGALLCFYYRQIAIYLPISPTLGPLLYKVRLMVSHPHCITAGTSHWCDATRVSTSSRIELERRRVEVF
ncbi:hypothetical protein ISCGN_013813 [Ixodes scapularis]